MTMTVSAHADEREILDWMGFTYQTILKTEATGGAMSIVDSTVPPGEGPPRHVHQAEDETFVILTGRCRFWVGGETFERGVGETAFVSRGTEHTFMVVGDEPCRHLVILTPGGFEGFFAAMAANRYAIPADMPEINEVAARFHLTFTGSPLSVVK
ncbi:MAG TPA: cupin domain-containing protein [Devosiaceae bacterium]